MIVWRVVVNAIGIVVRGIRGVKGEVGAIVGVVDCTAAGPPSEALGVNMRTWAATAPAPNSGSTSV